MAAFIGLMLEDVMAGKLFKKQNITESNAKTLNTWIILLFAAGAILRILLCWLNPPNNAYDNHYEPILMMLQSGSIPAKDACWQCYHPPVFYGLSAIVGKLFMVLGLKLIQIVKLLQFVNCLYGILTLVFLTLILKKVSLPDFAKVLAFGVACFLPRHIYMSAMNSNDTISYLFVAISVYLSIITIERKFTPLLVLATSMVISIALFTKYTTYAVLPAIIAPFIVLCFKDSDIPRKKIVSSLGLILFLPVVLLSYYFISNYKHYGSPLPWNVQQLDPSRTQPRDYSDMNFFSFKPWDGMETIMLAPDKIHSYWTLVYNGMWFDNEPRFLYLLDANRDWWTHYGAWLRGEMDYPGDNDSISFLTKLSGVGLVCLGLLPLFFLIMGGYRYVKKICDHWRKGEGLEIAKMSVFPMLLIGNAAIMIALVLRLPVFSATKASYFLDSLPVFAIFFSYGFAAFETSKGLKKAFVFMIGLLFALASLHILHICWALHQRPSLL
jgi:hypothetical protein